MGIFRILNHREFFSAMYDSSWNEFSFFVEMLMTEAHKRKTLTTVCMKIRV